MGPSKIVDGELITSQGKESRGPGFNGAVEDRRRRGCRPCATLRPARPSFNGAVEDRRRRGSSTAAGSCSPRRFNGAVEDRRRRARGERSLLLGVGASMGPSKIVDGESSDGQPPPTRDMGFNGAV